MKWTSDEFLIIQAWKVLIYFYSLWGLHDYSLKVNIKNGFIIKFSRLHVEFGVTRKIILFYFKCFI